MKLVSLHSGLKEARELADRALEPHPPSGLDEMLEAHAPEVRIVAYEVGELTTLLHEIAACQSAHFVLEAPDSEELREDVARVAETQGVIEIRGEKVLFDGHGRMLCNACAMAQAQRAGTLLRTWRRARPIGVHAHRGLHGCRACASR